MVTWQKFLRSWLDNDWLSWGAGALLSVNLGFFGTCGLLEAMISSGLARRSYIEYGQPREAALAKTREKIPFWTQLLVSAWTLLGPAALLNSALAAVVLPRMVRPGRSFPLLPGRVDFLCKFVAMELIGDFLLYVGHRILHEYLWDYHKYHHKIDTPTPASTACIDGLDVTIQSGIPTVMCALLTQPHPLTFYACTCARVAENVVNHSGMDHWLINLIFLKDLPFRAGVAVHDAHHKYSNYAENAKNFGENFLLWDWAFGTLGKVEATTRKERL